MNTHGDIPTLVTINGVPLKARRGFWLMVVLLWALLATVGLWRWPGQTLLAYVLVGGAGTLLAMMADIGHAYAHTLGAKMAHAPTAVILLGADMPRTLYRDEAVSPHQHLARSMGGPLYSWIGAAVGLVALRLTVPRTAGHYLAEIWTLSNGLIGAAILLPLPVVDGGVIVKWLLVMTGTDEALADKIVRRVDVVLALLLLVGVGIVALMGWWMAAVGLVALTVIIGLVLIGIIQ